MSNKIKDLNNPSPWNMRIWDEAKHQWLCNGEDDVLPYYGFDIRGGEVTAFQGIDWIYKQLKRWDDFTWERSTGLTDKNGKEIYEGDIVNITAIVTTDDSSMACIIDTNSIVCWDKEHARWDVNDKPEDEDLDYRRRRYFVFVDSEDRENVEVIGNIHEPPKDFRPEHLKRMGVSISKGGEDE